jgi:hypothetical protein
MLAYHNTLRAEIARGEGENMNSLVLTSDWPTATDMLEMIWDYELAAIAQSWAETNAADDLM